MSLWVDKHRPRELARLDYHKPLAQQLLNLAQQGDFPHLMFYGPSGAGKKTRIMCLLRELYGSGAERLRNETMSFTTPSNKKIEIMTVGSNYHLEVNPSDAGEFSTQYFYKSHKIHFKLTINPPPPTIKKASTIVSSSLN